MTLNYLKKNYPKTLSNPVLSCTKNPETLILKLPFGINQICANTLPRHRTTYNCSLPTGCPKPMWLWLFSSVIPDIKYSNY